MPDITMCTNKDCQLRFSCYRYRAVPSEYWQPKARFQPRIGECEAFEEIGDWPVLSIEEIEGGGE